MMNKAWKAIAAIMLVMVVAVSCKEPAEPNNGNNSVKNNIKNKNGLKDQNYTQKIEKALKLKEKIIT